jgi:hypothetical protein
MKKIIRLTESDLTKIVKRVIIEQKFQILSKLLRNGGDDLVAKYGDDVASKIDDVLATALSKTVNVGVNENGKQVLKSLRGTLIELDTIKGVLTTIMDGGDINELAILLPSRLADGSEFRTILQNELSKKIGKTTTSTLIRLGQQGEIYKKMLNELGNWIPIVTEKGNLSGWKFHIFTTTVDETAYALEKIIPIVKKYGASAKSAGIDMLQRLANNPLQKGKGITIYIPPSMIKNKQQRNFLSELQDSLIDLNTKGSISGDEMITNNIGYRYEFSKPIDSAIGVDYESYKKLYISNEGGPHNITGNIDLFK